MFGCFLLKKNMKIIIMKIIVKFTRHSLCHRFNGPIMLHEIKRCDYSVELYESPAEMKGSGLGALGPQADHWFGQVASRKDKESCQLTPYR